MQRKMTAVMMLWWCIVSASSHDRCLNGGNSFIMNGWKAARSAESDIYVYDGSLSDWYNLLLVILLVYLVITSLDRSKRLHY